MDKEEQKIRTKLNIMMWNETHEDERRERKRKYNKKYSERIAVQKKKYRQEHREEEKTQAKTRLRRIKIEAFSKITNGKIKCQSPKCLVPGGCTDIRALQIDHINGGGLKDVRGQKVYYKILKMAKEDAQKEYQLLCANCNWIKRFNRNEVRK